MTSDDNLTNITRIVCDGLLGDFITTYPTLSCDLLKDKCTIKFLIETRGIGFLTQDLPSLDQVLLSGLQDGYVTLRGPLTKRKGPRTRVPKLLSGLWLLVFDKEGLLRSEPDPNAIFFLRSIFAIGKRFLGTHSEKSEKEAKASYIQMEKEMREPVRNWGPHFDSDISRNLSLTDGLPVSEFPLPLLNGRSEGSSLHTLLTIIQHTCDEFSEEISRYDQYSFIKSNGGNECKHGPGSVADIYQSRDKYIFEGKWSSLLDRWFPFEEFAGTTYDLASLPILTTSKLICVPKDARGPRLIASEPVSNQYCQQGMLSKLMTIIKHSSLANVIDLSKQELSRELAKKASLNQKLATIDLSSASDRLSCWVVERVFRKAPILLSQLNACRTTQISIDGLIIPLKKFASQGSATNFPVQTIVYSLLCLGVERFNRLHPLGDNYVTSDEVRRKKIKTSVRCYGDDLIVAVEDVEKLGTVLSYCGLQVNHKKSFAAGFFRESCGGDYYRGHDVTPVRLKTSSTMTPTSRHALVTSSNAFFAKGLWRTSDVILEMIEDSKSFPIVGPDVGCFGLTSYMGSYYNYLKSRWNAHLHCMMYRVRVFKDAVRRTSQSALGGMRYRLITVPDRLTVGHHDSEVTKVSDNFRWVTLPPSGGRVNMIHDRS